MRIAQLNAIKCYKKKLLLENVLDGWRRTKISIFINCH